MFNIDDMTIVHKLALNACFMYYLGNDYKRRPSEFADFIELKSLGAYSYKIFPEGYKDEVRKACEIENKIIKTGAWIHKRAYKKAFRKLAWPSVKIPGYSKQQAIAEFREVIEFVRRRYEKN
jgi:hypothetical protein